MYKIKILKATNGKKTEEDIDGAFNAFFSENPNIIIKKIEIKIIPINASNVMEGYLYWGYIIYEEEIPDLRKKKDSADPEKMLMLALLSKMNKEKNLNIDPVMLVLLNLLNSQKAQENILQDNIEKSKI